MPADSQPTIEQIHVALSIVSLPVEFMTGRLRRAAEDVLLESLKLQD